MAVAGREAGGAVSARLAVMCSCGLQSSFSAALAALDQADSHCSAFPSHVVSIVRVQPEGWAGRSEVLERLAS